MDRATRRRNHIAYDPNQPKYRKRRVIEPKRREDEDERRFRRYGVEKHMQGENN